MPHYLTTHSVAYRKKVIRLEEKILKKVNYAIVRFTYDDIPFIKTIYGKTNLNKAINQITKDFGLPNSAIDIKMVTERREMDIETFLKNSSII